MCVAAGAGSGGGGGGGGGTGNTLTAPAVSATDGTFTDHVLVTWTAPAGATRYEVWRGPDNNVANAVKLSDVNGVNTYSDAAVDPGVIWFYFVRAFGDGPPPASSSFSVTDSGYAGSLVSTLGAASDLVATRGLSNRILDAQVRLVWTKVANAQSYDIYRNTSDNFSTATRISKDWVPFVFSDAHPTNYGPYPQFVDNGTELAYVDNVSTSASDPKAVTNYYYWVRAKRASPAAIGDPSTAAGATAGSQAGALGWGYGQGGGMGGLIPSGTPVYSGGADVPILAGSSKAWIVFLGSLAGGAGGNAAFGGGGGGASGVITGLLNVASTGKFRVTSTPEADPAAAPSATTGTAGPVTVLQYSTLGTFADTVNICTCGTPGAGVWNGAGGGAGGASATATADASVTPVNIYSGRAGYPAAGTNGGNSGYWFGFFRGPGCPLKITTQYGDAQGGHAGGGADADSPFPTQALGGKGLRGLAFLIFY